MQKANNHGDCFCTVIKRPAQKKKKKKSVARNSGNPVSNNTDTV